MERKYGEFLGIVTNYDQLCPTDAVVKFCSLSTAIRFDYVIHVHTAPAVPKSGCKSLTDLTPLSRIAAATLGRRRGGGGGEKRPAATCSSLASLANTK
jgi:histidine ammonia-lyase